MCKADRKLKLTERIAPILTDPRVKSKVIQRMLPMMRQWGYPGNPAEDRHTPWVFLDEVGVELTNNRAEGTLRFAVLWRKRSNGIRFSTS